MSKLGLVALQGAFREHREVFDALGAATVEVRTPEQLAGLDALVLPGGESTTMAKLLDSSGLRDPVARLLADGLPVLGTCAGLILLATDVLDGRADQWSFGAVDLSVRRNAYGTQLASFEAPLVIDGLPGPAGSPAPFPGVFIRAPAVERVGEGVDVLASHEGHPVLCRSRNVWVSTFHPELSGDLRLHQRFLQESSS
ncbi:MAG: pyridoxal 5'-phosphate synthase glutaminase subunit PdxT [Acidimicrobiia bacterium]